MMSVYCDAVGRFLQVIVFPHMRGMLLSAVHAEKGESEEPDERLNLLMVDSRIPAGAKLY